MAYREKDTKKWTAQWLSLIHIFMLDGKKGVAQKIVYGAFAKVEEKSGKPALEVFEEAMNNICLLYTSRCV